MAALQQTQDRMQRGRHNGRSGTHPWPREGVTRRAPTAWGVQCGKGYVFLLAGCVAPDPLPVPREP